MYRSYSHRCKESAAQLMADKKNATPAKKAEQKVVQGRAKNELNRTLPTERCGICGGFHVVHNVKGGD